MGSWQPACAHVTQFYLFAFLQAELLTEPDSIMFTLSGKLADFFFSCLWWVSKSCSSSGFDMSLWAAKLKERIWTKLFYKGHRSGAVGSLEAVSYAGLPHFLSEMKLLTQFRGACSSVLGKGFLACADL